MSRTPARERRQEDRPSSGPLIPEQYMYASRQKLYFLSFGLLCQAIKIMAFRTASLSEGTGFTNFQKWMAFDIAYCLVLASLRLPGLTYGKAIVFLLILAFAITDYILFREVANPVSEAITFSGFSGIPEASTQGVSFFGFLFSILPFSRSAGRHKDFHLLGEHSIRMSPINTAQLNPDGLGQCIPGSSQSAFIPLLLKGGKVAGVRYSFTSLEVGENSREIQFVELGKKDFKASERLRNSQIRQSSLARGGDFQEEFSKYSRAGSWEHETVVFIRISKPGTLRLERVLDDGKIDFRILYPSEMTIAQCPRMEFTHEPSYQLENIRCLGHNPDVQFVVELFGLGPLIFKWSRTVDGVKDDFRVEVIDHDNVNHSGGESRQRPIGSNQFSSTSGAQAIRSDHPQKFRVPLKISLDRPGEHIYTLEEVTDGIGNTVHIERDRFSPHDTASITKSTRLFTVLRRPTAAFKDCGVSSMLIGSGTTLVVSTNASYAFDSPLDVLVRYKPAETAVYVPTRRSRASPWEKSFMPRGNSRELNVEAIAPGEYTIIGVQGKKCKGDVVSPKTCKVVEKATPTVKVQWRRMEDCTGETGITASLTFNGTAPFQIHYRIQADNEPAHELTKSFTSTSGELAIQPRHGGRYTFSIFRLGDADYRNLDLRGLTFEQTIPQSATVEFVSSPSMVGNNLHRRVITTCNTTTVPVVVQFKGFAPWDLAIRLRFNGQSKLVHFHEIQESLKTLDVPIPPSLQSEGGSFDADIVSLQDFRKCNKDISVPGISVSVHTDKPTASFIGPDRFINILEGVSAKLPLQLTGHGPWRIRYRRAEARQLVLTTTVTDAAKYIHASENGLYELVDVSDSRCIGVVTGNQSTFKVDWIPKPVATLSAQTSSSYDAYNRSHILQPLCQAAEAYAYINLIGRAPFQVVLNIVVKTVSDGGSLSYHPTFNVAQSPLQVQLQTSQASRVFYFVEQIGDVNYPLTKQGGSVIPADAQLVMEHQVFVRPSSRFQTVDRLAYHLMDAFVPLDASSTGGVLILEGVPPFNVQISIKSLTTREIETMMVTILSHLWKISLPSYGFKAVGSHLVTIESVSDASGFTQTGFDPSFRSIYVDVSAIASITPHDHREHICVGDISQFHLDGTSPWTIGYRINGKSFAKETKASPFAISQTTPGEFVITSITHEGVNRPIVPNMRYMVHSLPSASVARGERVYQDITEGDQAEIIFTFRGEPPFTFTYQRSELGSKDGRPGKLLETKTISNIGSNIHTITASMEGGHGLSYS
ncbi:hypothetical protein BDQ12DRAFT_459576 [Crucibulum laeve]|uniref:Nucleoporin Pom152 n=1 Tax=Crucibulum laeve TaxID=68775 RepID=A0A5C3M835_9AGAR|nr:hypothetical protein BDQ12DRAFT_459576 [Crucibulum laeve]